MLPVNSNGITAAHRVNSGVLSSDERSFTNAADHF